MLSVLDCQCPLLPMLWWHLFHPWCEWFHSLTVCIAVEVHKPSVIQVANEDIPVLPEARPVQEDVRIA